MAQHRLHGIEVTNHNGKTFSYCGREGDMVGDQAAVTCIHCLKRIKLEERQKWYIERSRRMKEQRESIQ